MARRFNLLLAVLLLASAVCWRRFPQPAQARSARVSGSPPAAALSLSIQPAQIEVGRDVALQIRVADGHGKPVMGALISLTGLTRPLVGTAGHGAITFTVHATALGTALLQATRAGYRAATLKVAIVPGAPATIVSFKRGVSVRAPGAKPVPGALGMDLPARYHGLTGTSQYASLGLRDGTLVDMDSNTDVLITDPLHTTLSKGELFLEVVHGSVSHQVQVGSAVAATKGTRLDVRLDPKTKSAVVTVVEGRVQVSNKGKSVLVGAGQQSTVPPGKAPSTPKPVDLSQTLAWIKNLPNTTSTTIPPILILPRVSPAQIPLPPIAPTPTMTATTPLQSSWSGVVLVPGSADVPAGTTLTIAPGTVVEMESGTTLTVEGTLTAQGTAGSPIIFTSAADTPQPGDWQYIAIDGTDASGSALSYVHAYYGGSNGGDAGMLSITGGATPAIANSIFADGDKDGIYIDDTGRPTISDCAFGDDDNAAISTPAEAANAITGTTLGAGQAGIEVRDTTITTNTTWHRQDAPYMVAGGTLDAGSTLTIEAGTVIEMDAGAMFTAQGTLLAQGTAVAPIIVTSAASQPQPGDWQYIAIDGNGASRSALTYVQMFYGGSNGGDDGMLSSTGGATPTIGNGVFAQATKDGIYADDDSRPTIGHCIFAGNAGSAMDLPADGAALVTGTALGPNQAPIEVRDTHITHGGTWHRQNAPLLLDGATLDAGVTLTVEPGTLIEMGSGAVFTVQGTLLAQGTAAAPIIITSAAAQPRPGDWQYMAIDGNGANKSALSYVEVRYGSSNGGDDGALSITGGATPAIRYCTVVDSAQVGIWADDGTAPTIADCSFARDGGPAISIPKSDTARVHDNAFAPGQQGLEVRT